MENNNVLLVVQVIMLVAMGILTWLRVPFQNTSDASQSVKNLSDALDSALKRQRELEAEQEALAKKYNELNDMLKEKNYSITLVFQLGDQPIVKSVTIQPVAIIK